MFHFAQLDRLVVEDSVIIVSYKTCSSRRRTSGCPLCARSRTFASDMITLKSSIDMRGEHACQFCVEELAKNQESPKAEVSNFIANKELGTQSDIHENVY